MQRFVAISLLFAAAGWAAWRYLPQLQGLRGEGAPAPAAAPRVAPGDWQPELPPDGGPPGRPRLAGPVHSQAWDPDGFRFHVEVPGWAAAAYGDAPPAQPLDRAARGVVERLGRSDRRYDDALGRAAEALAVLEAEADVPLTGALTDFVLNRAGVVVPAVRRFLYFSSQEDRDGFLAHLGEVLTRDGPAAPQRVGVGHADGARDARFHHTYVILVATPKVEIERLPRSVAPGARVTVAGRLLGGLGAPRVLYLVPGGVVEEAPVRTSGPAGFHATIELPTREGEVWLEVLGDGDRGPEVAALFPIYGGRPPPDRFEGIAPPEEGAMGSPQALADLMYDLVNLDRARFGLPPLARDPGLEAVALRHAQDMRDNDFVAHVSPTTGSVGDRARASRYANLALGENVARDESVYSAEAALMRSLGHRENILNARFTHVGIGVAIEERLGGGRALSIVQNFAVPAEPVDPATEEARIRDTINRARTSHDDPPLERQADLERVARAAALDLDAPDATAGAVRRALERDRPRVGDIAIRTYILPALDAFDPPDAALDAAARWIGVAVAQSGRLDEEPRIWLVLLTAAPLPHE